MPELIIIQSPTAARHLVLLFHGVGSNPENMIPLGRLIAKAQPLAAVISVPSPDACDLGAGYQWFSVRGITEGNRPQRVADTMLRFFEAIETLQKYSGLSADQTTLIGFSQGGIMVLEASKSPHPAARRIIAIAGRFAELPDSAPAASAVHLIHGVADPVVACANSVAAAERLKQLGANVTIDLIPSLGHTIDGEVAQKVIDRLADHG